MVVSSCIDGRMRLRSTALREASVAEELRESLTALPGVISVAINARVGSLLVLYDAGVARAQSLVDAAAASLGCAAPPSAAKRTRLASAVVNWGMLLSLLASMMGAIVGGEMVHIAAGVLFLGFLAVHLYRRRSGLFSLR